MKLSQKDETTLPKVLEQAKYITKSKNGYSQDEKSQAAIFINFYEKYMSIDGVSRSERDYMRDYIRLYRISINIKKKQEKEQNKNENYNGKKRRVLNNSKFYIGGMFYSLLKNHNFDSDKRELQFANLIVLSFVLDWIVMDRVQLYFEKIDEKYAKLIIHGINKTNSTFNNIVEHFNPLLHNNYDISKFIFSIYIHYDKYEKFNIMIDAKQSVIEILKPQERKIADGGVQLDYAVGCLILKMLDDKGYIVFDEVTRKIKHIGDVFLHTNEVAKIGEWFNNVGEPIPI